MVRTLGGEWVTFPGDYLGNPDFGVDYCIRCKGIEHLDVTDSMLETSISARTRRYSAALFETNAMLCAS